ncbi:MAG: hypothetical protein SGILL_003947 [Bacillariaceae sp.]
MPLQVKKAKTAFLFFQSDQLAKIRNELNLSMGDAMTESHHYIIFNCSLPSQFTSQLATRWRNMSETEKSKYLQLEKQDRERFNKESAEADDQRLKDQEARRKALTVQEGEDISSRGARARLQEEREEAARRKEERRLQREAEMGDDERAERDRAREQKRQETEARRKQKAQEEKAVAKQHTKLDKEEAKKTANRLEYLFKQSPIFAKLRMGVGSMEDATEEETAAAKKKAEEEMNGGKRGRGRPKSSSSNGGNQKKPHHIHDKDSEVEDEDAEEEEEEQLVFLTKQPSVIKFGQLKPYQLESLNWMIHLAEKGLNGILADEVG